MVRFCLGCRYWQCGSLRISSRHWIKKSGTKGKTEGDPNLGHGRDRSLDHGRDPEIRVELGTNTIGMIGMTNMTDVTNMTDAIDVTNMTDVIDMIVLGLAVHSVGHMDLATHIIDTISIPVTAGRRASCDQLFVPPFVPQ